MTNYSEHQRWRPTEGNKDDDGTRRIMLTTIRASSTPVMKMLVTMLLMLMTLTTELHCDSVAHLYWLTTLVNHIKLTQWW